MPAETLDKPSLTYAIAHVVEACNGDAELARTAVEQLLAGQQGGGGGEGDDAAEPVTEDAVMHSDFSATRGQLSAGGGGRRREPDSLLEAEGASGEDAEDAAAYARLMAGVLNALAMAHADTDDLADELSEELEDSGWMLAKHPRGLWVATPAADPGDDEDGDGESDALTEAVLPLTERIIVGTDKRGRKYGYDTELKKRVSVTGKTPGKSKERLAAKAQSGHRVDHAALAQRLAAHHSPDEVAAVHKQNAARAARAIQRHHGEHAAARIEELADALESTLTRLDGDDEHSRRAAGVIKAKLRQLSGMLSALSQPAAPKRQKGSGKPAAPEYGRVYNAATEDLHVDPARFQYKLNTDASGVTAELKSVRTWNPDFAGVVSVWQDPQDGKTYVVNGHHRRELAGRLGVDNLAVRYVQAKTAKEARAIGALVNIAEGRGTAIDAAKFLRDAGVGIDELEKRGVSLKGKVAVDAAALTRLSDKQFDRLARGLLDEGKALAVAKHLEDHALQDQLFGLLDKREEDGKDLSLRVVEEMAREMAETPKTTRTEKSLFGDIESEESLFVQRAEVKAHVRSALAREVSDFLAVSSKRRAERVSGAGNVLDTDRNREIATEAERVKNTFDTLVNSRGHVSDAINQAAEQYAKATTRRDKDAAKQRAVEAVRDAVRRELSGETVGAGEGGGAGSGGGTAGAGPGGGEGAADAGRGDPGAAGLRAEEGPKEGDKDEAGLVFRDGRWRREEGGDAGEDQGRSADDVAEPAGRGAAALGGSAGGGTGGVGRGEAATGGEQHPDPSGGGESEEELRRIVQRDTHTLNHVADGTHPVGVDGRGGKDMEEAKRRGMFTAVVNGVKLFARTEEDARPLIDYLNAGGKYGTPEFSRLLGYTPEQIENYRKYLQASGQGHLDETPATADSAAASRPEDSPYHVPMSRGQKAHFTKLVAPVRELVARIVSGSVPVGREELDAAFSAAAKARDFAGSDEVAYREAKKLIDAIQAEQRNRAERARLRLGQGTTGKADDPFGGELKVLRAQNEADREMAELKPAKPVHHSDDVAAALARYDARDSLPAASGALFGGDDARSREGFANLPDGTEVVVTEGPRRGHVGRISHETSLNGDRKTVVRIDGDDRPTPVSHTAVEPLAAHQSWRTEAGAQGKKAGDLFAGGEYQRREQTDAQKGVSAIGGELNALARSGAESGTVRGFKVERKGVGQFRVELDGGQSLRGDQAQVANWIHAAEERMKARAAKAAPAEGQPGFTGTDSLGREWRDGELVARGEEAAPPPSPDASPTAAPSSRPDAPGTPAHYAAWKSSRFGRGNGEGGALTPAQEARARAEYEREFGAGVAGDGGNAGEKENREKPVVSVQGGEYTSGGGTGTTPGGRTMTTETAAGYRSEHGEVVPPSRGSMIHTINYTVPAGVPQIAGQKLVRGVVESHPQHGDVVTFERHHNEAAFRAAGVKAARISLKADKPGLGELVDAHRKADDAHVAAARAKAQREDDFHAMMRAKEKAIRDTVPAGKIPLDYDLATETWSAGGVPLAGLGVDHRTDVSVHGEVEEVAPWGSTYQRVVRVIDADRLRQLQAAKAERDAAQEHERTQKASQRQAAAATRRADLIAKARQTGQKQVLSQNLVRSSDGEYEQYRTEWIDGDGVVTTTYHDE